MKYLKVVLLTVIITVSIGMVVKKAKISSTPRLVSPLIAGTNTSVIAPSEPTSSSIYSWPVFSNNYYNYRIKYPSTVSIKNKKNGDISLQKEKSIDIYITQNVLSKNATINTIIEKDIDIKKRDLKEKFTLQSAISPIALSAVTAQTYSSIENGRSLTYYYIPQKDQKFLLVTNLTPNIGSADYLISEDIIYSIEPTP